jgi:hypothetical protein
MQVTVKVPTQIRWSGVSAQAAALTALVCALVCAAAYRLSWASRASWKEMKWATPASWYAGIESANDRR